MASELKDHLLSLRISENDHKYLCSTAISNGVSSSEIIRAAIKKSRDDKSEPARFEVIAYLRNLSAPEREKILDKVERTRKREMKSFMNDAIARKPAIKGKELCKLVSEKFDLPVNLDLKHRVYLAIKSRRRRKKLVEKLEKEY